MHKKEFAENGSILLEMNVECKIEHAKWVESLNLVPNGTKGFSRMLHGTLQARDALG